MKKSLPLVVALLAGLGVALSSHASFADEKDVCIASHEKAQTLRNEGHVKEARHTLLECARDVCPKLITNDCRPWLDEANANQPTVVLSVRDENDVETSDVRVSLDGALLTEHLDGRPVDIDPGDHVLRFERPNVAPVEKHVFLHAKEKAVIVSAAFARSTGSGNVLTVQPVPSSRWSTGVIVSGIVGGVALGTFAAFGISGKIAEGNLSSSGCAPNCDAGKINDIRTLYIAAYIALGVGVLGLGTGAVLFIAAPTTDARGGIAMLTGRF